MYVSEYCPYENQPEVTKRIRRPADRLRLLGEEAKLSLGDSGELAVPTQTPTHCVPTCRQVYPKFRGFARLPGADRVATIAVANLGGIGYARLVLKPWS